METERVPCDLCGSDSTKLYQRARSRYGEEEFNVVRCAGCGLVYVNPRPADKELSIRRHSSDDALVRSTQDTFTPQLVERGHLLSLVRLARIRELLPGGRILDFGCGNGVFVFTALSEGWDAWGIDLNEGRVRAASMFWRGETLGPGWMNARMEMEGGLPAAVERYRRSDRFSSDPLRAFARKHAGSFDLINSSQVLEHLVSPSRTVAVLSTMLRRKGWLVADVPNIRCWREIVRRGSTLDPTAHLYYFDRRTIRRLLEKSGFEVAYTDTRLTLFGLWIKALAPLGLKSLVPPLAGAARLAPLPPMSSTLFVAAQKK